MAAPRPHDLLRLADYASELPADAPEWVRTSLTRTPWVVARRAVASPGLVPVGVRGRRRAQRYAMTVPHNAVEQTVTPEQLRGAAPTEDRGLSALVTLRMVRPYLDSTGLVWGPTGSVGFELATGHHTVTEDSDLDVVLRIGHLTSTVLQQLSSLHTLLLATSARVDCQLDCPAGAVALAEIISADAQVIVRTAEGPRLLAAAELSR